VSTSDEIKIQEDLHHWPEMLL